MAKYLFCNSAGNAAEAIALALSSGVASADQIVGTDAVGQLDNSLIKWASPGAIGSVVASTIKGTTGTFTGLNLGASGALYAGDANNSYTPGSGALKNYTGLFSIINSGTATTLVQLDGTRFICGIFGSAQVAGRSVNQAGGSFGRDLLVKGGNSESAAGVVGVGGSLTLENGLPTGGASAGRIIFKTYAAAGTTSTEVAAFSAAGAFTANVSLQIGSSGTPLLKLLSAIATLDFPSIPAQASADLTITVTGSAINDFVQLGLPASPASGINFQAFVSAANTVTVRAANYTAAAIDPASASYRVSVMGF